MRRFTSILILLVCSIIVSASPATARWWNTDDTLIAIDGTRYSTEDFKRWWRFWNDEGLDLPETLNVYIDWLLLAREGERMELAADPGFQRQTRVFLQSRTLLMLKYDAINSRIEISDDELWARYEEKSTPRWLIQRLHFQDADAAAAAWKELSEGELSIDALLERNAEEGGPVTSHENWLRPSGIDPGWAAIFRNLTVGEVVAPDEHEGGLLLYHLKDQKEGDKEDFTRLQEGVRRELWKEKENKLTFELLADLRRKYEVEVDEERLAALDLNGPEDSFTEAVLISTSRQKVSEKDFMAIARRDMAQRPDAAHAGFDEEKARELKARVVSGIIAQSVTNWEALDRRYEEREPFKWEYDFHVAHRLTTELERRLFASRVIVTPDEIKKNYEENQGRYTQPALVKLHIIDDTQGPVDRVWADVVTGKDFSRAVREHLDRRISSQEVPANHLDPEIKAVVDRLAVGETSQPFRAQGSRVIVHLGERTPERPLPLERVTKSIRDRLEREKIEEQRRTYLDLLKSRSKIEVRERRWQALKKEIGGAK